MARPLHQAAPRPACLTCRPSRACCCSRASCLCSSSRWSAASPSVSPAPRAAGARRATTGPRHCQSLCPASCAPARLSPSPTGHMPRERAGRWRWAPSALPFTAAPKPVHVARSRRWLGVLSGGGGQAAAVEGAQAPPRGSAPRQAAGPPPWQTVLWPLGREGEAEAGAAWPGPRWPRLRSSLAFWGTRRAPRVGTGTTPPVLVKRTLRGSRCVWGQVPPTSSALGPHLPGALIRDGLVTTVRAPGTPTMQPRPPQR